MDRRGFRDLMIGRELWLLLMENVSNAFDADCKVLDVNVRRRQRSPFVQVTFEDDGEGFSDIKLAYTFYADTERRSNPAKRGRFTVGEKNLLAVAEEAVIETRNKRLTFDSSGRHTGTLKTPRQGTLVKLLIRMTLNDEHEILEKLKHVHVPDGVTYRVNGFPVPLRPPIKSFTATFISPIKTEDGSIRSLSRTTEVRLYQSNSEAYLFELGIPVQPIQCGFDVDIQQKIPLSQERDMVSDHFLQDVYAEVLNMVIDELPEDSAAETWVRIGLSDMRCQPETVAKVKLKRFGEKAVLWSSDLQANEQAIGEGYQIIHPKTLSEEERERFEETGLKHSSDIFGRIGTRADIVKPTPAMQKIADLAKSLAKELLDREITVSFHSLFGGPSAEYGYGQLQFNVASLGKAWFEQGITPDTVGVILHELAHDKANDPDYAHGATYQREAMEINGKAALLARNKPDRYREIFGEAQ